MNFARKYGTAATLDGVPLVTTGSDDYQANPTLAAGDVKISKDGGAFTNVTDLPAVTPASGRAVRVTLTATEMQAARIVVQFVDQTSPKEWADQFVIVETFGNASAQEALDRSVNQTGDSYALANGANGFVATKADTAAILLDTGTDGVVLAAAGLAGAACNKIADHVRRRTQANVEASSDGDTLGFNSEYGATQKQTGKVAVVGTNLVTYKTDGTTALGTQAITENDDANPITGLGAG